jgi:hypothetical protein
MKSPPKFLTNQPIPLEITDFEISGLGWRPELLVLEVGSGVPVCQFN